VNNFDEGHFSFCTKSDNLDEMSNQFQPYNEIDKRKLNHWKVKSFIIKISTNYDKFIKTWNSMVYVYYVDSKLKDGCLFCASFKAK
jgi:hypothetical protein